MTPNQLPPDNSQWVAPQNIEVTAVHQGTAQEIVIITSDKLQLTINNHMDSLRARQAWQTPSALFVSLLASLLTAEFHDAFSITAPVWHAMYLILTVGSFAWLVFEGYRYFMLRNCPSLLKEIKDAGRPKGS